MTTDPHLAVQRMEKGVLRLVLAGDWLAVAGLPGLQPVEQERAAGDR